MNYSIKQREERTFEVTSLYEAFRQLSNRLKARGRHYKLALVLSLSALAKFVGEDEPEGIADWVKLRGEMLGAALEIKRAHATSCHLPTRAR
jgi:hypothetical protein